MMESKVDTINNINEIFSKFKIKASCVDYYQLHKSNCYEIRLDPTTKIKAIEKYSTELALSLRERSIPKFNLILDKGVVRMDFVHPGNNNLDYFSYAKSQTVPEGYQVPVLLGKSVYGEPVWMDLLENPHLLISGCTGSGKSVAMHAIIANILKMKDYQLFLIDPKNIEFNSYEEYKNIKVIYSYQECLELLDHLNNIMENRFISVKNGLNIHSMKPIVVMIDEFSDLSLQDNNRQLYNKLCKLAQKCRAAKISIILGTQRPSAKLLDGNIKANFPARLACKAASSIDSKIILDEKGAEKLSGRGDAILKSYNHDNVRLQIAYTNINQINENFASYG